jgi:hypothetical protein
MPALDAETLQRNPKAAVCWAAGKDQLASRIAVCSLDRPAMLSRDVHRKVVICSDSSIRVVHTLNVIVETQGPRSKGWCQRPLVLQRACMNNARFEGSAPQRAFDRIRTPPFCRTTQRTTPCSVPQNLSCYALRLFLGSRVRYTHTLERNRSHTALLLPLISPCLPCREHKRCEGVERL